MPSHVSVVVVVVVVFVVVVLVVVVVVNVVVVVVVVVVVAVVLMVDVDTYAHVSVPRAGAAGFAGASAGMYFQMSHGVVRPELGPTVQLGPPVLPPTFWQAVSLPQS